MLAARGILEDLYKPSSKFAEIIYKCTTCGFCRYKCALDTVELIEAFRADLVDAGLSPSEHKTLIEWTVKYQNPYYKRKAKPENRGLWAEEISFKPASDTLFFAGCTLSFLYPDLAKTAALVMTKAGVEMTYLRAKENCCGSWMHRTGHLSAFERQVENNFKIFNEIKTKRVITMCAGCYRTLKTDYPEHAKGFEIEVLHGVQLLAKLVNENRIRFKEKVNMRVTYHDPCHLARYMRIIEEPRTILENIPGVQLIEAETTKYNAYCCGGGGGLLSAFSDLAIQIALQRLQQLEATGAEAIVTACPFCETALSQAIKQKRATIKLYDITELIARAMGIAKKASHSSM
jgi:Fe-S oxidoreductase